MGSAMSMHHHVPFSEITIPEIVVRSLHEVSHIAPSRSERLRSAKDNTLVIYVDAFDTLFQRPLGDATVAEVAGKRVLEYGARAPVFYGSLREQAGEQMFLRKPTDLALFLQKSPKLFGHLFELWHVTSWRPSANMFAEVYVDVDIKTIAELYVSLETMYHSFLLQTNDYYFTAEVNNGCGLLLQR